MIAVLLSAILGPGAGQLYNREFKKGWLLIGISLIGVIVLTVSGYRAIMSYVTNDVATMDVQQLAELGDKIQNEFSMTKSTVMLGCSGFLLVLWGYGIIDAWQGSKRRAALENLQKKELLK